MPDRRNEFIITAFLSLTFVLAIATPAFGATDIVTPQWSTSGYQGGTHRWATAQAIAIAASRGSTWVNPVAIDRAIYPDTVFRDNIDHNANWWGSYPSYYNKSWGNRFGNPQGKVQSYYNLAVAALRRGDNVEASKNIGYLSHYFIDINGPMHTQESATEDSSFHTSLEDDAGNFNFGSYMSDDGYQYRGNPSQFTVDCANASHEYYSSLISAFSAHGFNSTVKDIEGRNLNRGVNGLADLIVSAQADANPASMDPVAAVIDSVSPSSATTGQPVTFVGHGTDAVHLIEEWLWRSSNDGPISAAPQFSTSTLSLGVHNIYFSVRCGGPKWSTEALMPVVIGAKGTTPLPIYRFYNVRTGVHFYTASEAERDTVRNGLSSTYTFEGVGYAEDSANPTNSTPLYRFYNFKQGVHFYTASESERDNVINTMGDTYRYEGEAYRVSSSPDGTQPVYRFYNMRKGVHFYTASESERDNVINTMGETYRYEGVAYYYAPPW